MKKNNQIKKAFKLLKMFYSVSSFLSLLRSVFSDFLSALLLNSGSGFLTSLFKGLIGHLIIKSKYPLFIGKRTKFINIHNISFGKNVRIADDVSIIAYGKITLGDNVIIGEKTTLIANEELVVGNDVVVTRNCYIAQLGGPIFIERNVLIGDYTRIHSINHTYQDRNLPLYKQHHTRNKIQIKENAWIGSGVMVINNTVIGKRSVIGANAVVTKNIPDFTVAVGIPAKVIKKIHEKN